MELVDILEANGGVAKISSVGRVARQARRAAREGHVIRPLPRIVMSTAAARHPEAWIRAVKLWRPTAVFTGRAALYLAGMRDLKITEIDVIVPHSMPWRSRRRWLRFHRAASEPVVEDRYGVRTTRAYTCFWLALRGDWEAATQCLREGYVTSDELREVRRRVARKAPHSVVRRVLRQLLDRPWSVAEREIHALFRRHRISGWKANERLWIGGDAVVPDLWFKKENAVVEVDSYAFHGGAADYEATARRHALMVGAGFRVIRITPNMIRDNPELVLDTVRSALWSRHKGVAATV
ncbi:DUF559 domain-containing protein [Cutibacterium sp. WCA-380-WT-3A]|uniref:DUF559 domain-containing protein n=1 Tax=Cutibacterium porci TaxID=2605781 RepID=A0A7K0J3T8_9ACTN|nr:DUF559 domain-containing protein [Cutibacterium porci]MSS44595.1 DUF559 domain-containing protein [Cutibacterium porci]